MPPDIALFTDLYELTMVQAYLEDGLTEEAVFSLYVRDLPERRNYLLACGQQEAIQAVESFRFTDEEIDYLRTLDLFQPPFLDWLSDYRFRGTIRAVAEGTPIFADEPVLEVIASLPEAQLLETFLMNQVHLQTTLASKATRIVEAASGKPVIDFAARRTHGMDAALQGSLAFYKTGIEATSNVLAGKRFGIPVTGTMAHSYIQAHKSEKEAFRSFVSHYPGTILLIDTYDTLEAVDRIGELANELGDDFRIRGVRIDSGDLEELSRAVRQKLDSYGLDQIEIVVSGGLDEEKIAALVSGKAPIDGFGVGTSMGVSKDAPSLNFVYKLCEYHGKGVMKLSPGKPILPGPKQVFRQLENRVAHRDIIGGHDESLPGSPLLKTAMRHGQSVHSWKQSLPAIRAYCKGQRNSLPDAVRSIQPADPPYDVEVSPALQARTNSIQRELEQQS
ncbi:MAG: nicotinate phosphoribosyltransferase [Bacteroidota bacterium]